MKSRVVMFVVLHHKGFQEEIPGFTVFGCESGFVFAEDRTGKGPAKIGRPLCETRVLIR
jgi:hypothetical protein